MSAEHMEKLPSRPYAGLSFLCPHRKQWKVVKWVSDGHVQFDNATSCALDDWSAFYGGALAEIQSQGPEQ